MVTLSFPVATQAEESLRATAYRLARSAVCHVERRNDQWVCELTAKGTRSGTASDQELRESFLIALNDENLRALMRERTEPVRNLILALAFGALARNDEPTSA